MMTKRTETIVTKPRIPYGSEKTSWPPGPCHDCGVKRGQLHLVGCDVEECPICGEQLLSCTVEGKHD